MDPAARRGSAAVEFQTSEMLAEQVAGDQLDIYLTVEEAEALAEVAESAEVPDKRNAAVVRQAAEQIRLLAGQVRDPTWLTIMDPRQACCADQRVRSS